MPEQELLRSILLRLEALSRQRGGAIWLAVVTLRWLGVGL